MFIYRKLSFSHGYNTNSSNSRISLLYKVSISGYICWCKHCNVSIISPYADAKDNSLMLPFPCVCELYISPYKILIHELEIYTNPVCHPLSPLILNPISSNSLLHKYDCWLYGFPFFKRRLLYQLSYSNLFLLLKCLCYVACFTKSKRFSPLFFFKSRYFVYV